MNIEIEKIEIATRLRSFREKEATWKEWILLRYREARRLNYELILNVCEAMAVVPIRTNFLLFESAITY